VTAGDARALRDGSDGLNGLRGPAEIGSGWPAVGQDVLEESALFAAAHAKSKKDRQLQPGILKVSGEVLTCFPGIPDHVDNIVSNEQRHAVVVAVGSEGPNLGGWFPRQERAAAGEVRHEISSSHPDDAVILG